MRTQQQQQSEKKNDYISTVYWNTIEMEGKGTKGRKPSLSCHIRRKYQLLFFWGEAFHPKRVGFITVHNRRGPGERPSKCASCITYAKKWAEHPKVLHRRTGVILARALGSRCVSPRRNKTSVFDDPWWRPWSLANYYEKPVCTTHHWYSASDLHW